MNSHNPIRRFPFPLAPLTGSGMRHGIAYLSLHTVDGYASLPKFAPDPWLPKHFGGTPPDIRVGSAKDQAIER